MEAGEEAWVCKAVEGTVGNLEAFGSIPVGVDRLVVGGNFAQVGVEGAGST